jgi:hypothetical protein
MLDDPAYGLALKHRTGQDLKDKMKQLGVAAARRAKREATQAEREVCLQHQREELRARQEEEEKKSSEGEGEEWEEDIRSERSTEY